MNFCLPLTDLREAFVSLPEAAEWPEVADIFLSRTGTLRLDWQLPVLACRAVGGNPGLMAPAAAAMGCLQCSIILVDDLLDQDPRGAHHRLGEGRAANLGLAFQAAALALIDRMPVDEGCRASAMAAVAQAALTTARGQELDVENLQGEASYWRVVKAKSTPFYGLGLKLGALLSGAGPEVAQRLYDAGAILGTMIQIYDDLEDALACPANPDWQESRNNLLLLYASTTEHAGRARLAELRTRVTDPAALKAAQQILISCGAVSYAVYLLARQYQAGVALVRGLPLHDPSLILDLFSGQMKRLDVWLRQLGLAVPDELRGTSS